MAISSVASGPGMMPIASWPWERGLDLTRVLSIDDMVSGDDVYFAASGITSGDFLRGVEYRAGGASSESLVMRSRSGTIRRIQTEHHWRKLQQMNEDQRFRG